MSKINIKSFTIKYQDTVEENNPDILLKLGTWALGYLGFYSWSVVDKTITMPMWLIHIDFLLYEERSDFFESIGVLAHFSMVVNIMLKINLYIFAYFCALINYMWIWYLNASEEHLLPVVIEKASPHVIYYYKEYTRLFFLKWISDYSNFLLSMVSFSLVYGLKILNKKIQE